MVKNKFKSEIQENHLTLSGRLTVEHAKELHEALKKALESAQYLEINLEGVEAVDLSSLQLFHSAYKSATAHKKRILISGPVPECIREAVVEAGFYYEVGEIRESEDDRSWLKVLGIVKQGE